VKGLHLAASQSLLLIADPDAPSNLNMPVVPEDTFADYWKQS
jgi:hypothetical protein